MRRAAGRVLHTRAPRAGGVLARPRACAPPRSLRALGGVRYAGLLDTSALHQFRTFQRPKRFVETSAEEAITTLMSDDDLHPVFDFTEAEIDQLWSHAVGSHSHNEGDSLDRAGMIKAIISIISFQHQKLRDIAEHKLQEEARIEGDTIPAVPLWIQWGIQTSVEQLDAEIQAIEAITAALRPDAKLTAKLLSLFMGEGSGAPVTKARFVEVLGTGAMRAIELEDLEHDLQLRQKLAASQR